MKTYLDLIMNISNKKLNKIGDLYRKTSDIDSNDLYIIENWRAEHYTVLRWFRGRIESLFKSDKDKLVVQRLKRMPTILDKLTRYKDMKLSRMQDIAGMRIICTDISHLNKIFDKLNTKHPKKKFILGKINNYIKEPKESGYRGIHCIFKYDSKGNINTAKYDKFTVEVQIRTKLQHLWATAVEVATFFTQENLKSSLGDKEWLEFFKLVSDLFSQIEDNNSIDKKMIKSLKNLYNTLQVKDILSGMSVATKVIQNHKKNKASICYVLYLNIEHRHMTLHPYKDFKTAAQDYHEKEKEIKDKNKNGIEHVVLIPQSNVKNIEKSYQNFFLDTNDFISTLESQLTN